MTGHELVSKLSKLGPDLLKLPVRGRYCEYARGATTVSIAGAHSNLEIIYHDEDRFDDDSVQKFILID